MTVYTMISTLKYRSENNFFYTPPRDRFIILYWSIVTHDDIGLNALHSSHAPSQVKSIAFRPIPFVRQVEELVQRQGEEFASAEPSMLAASARGGKKGSKVSVLHFLSKRDRRA